MCAKMILTEKLLFTVLLVFLEKLPYSVLISMTSYVFGQISIRMLVVLFTYLCFIANVDPRKDWILGNIIIVSSCYFIKPL
jgi:hypothetical protein